MKDASIRKDIFVAVISGGSLQQKEHWKATCEKAAEWVFGEGHAQAPDSYQQVSRTRRKSPNK